MFTENKVLVWLILLNGLVAITGFCKDLSIASYLGTTAEADAFMGAFFIVDTASGGIFASAIGIAFSSALGKAIVSSGKVAYLKVLKRAFLVCLVSSLVFTSGLGLFSRFFASSFTKGTLPSSQLLFLYFLLLPMAFLLPMFSAVSGALQAADRFIVTSVMPNVLNLLVVFLIIMLFQAQISTSIGTRLLSVGFDTGALFMVLGVIAAWIRWKKVDGYSLTACTLTEEPPLHAKNQESHTVLLAMARTVLLYSLYLVIQQSVGFVERVLASELKVGALASLSYATRIAQLPLFIIVAAVGTMLLPRLSGSIARQNAVETTQLVRKALFICWLVCPPTAVLLFVLRTQIVQLLFGHGAFGTDSVLMTSRFLGGYSLAIVSQAIAVVLFRCFIAQASIWVPVLISAAATLVNIVFDICLVHMLGPMTFGIGVAIGNTLMVIGLWSFMQERIGIIFRKSLALTWRMVACNFVVLCLALFVRRIESIPQFLFHPPVEAVALVGGLVGIAVLYVMSLIGARVIAPRSETV